MVIKRIKHVDTIIKEKPMRWLGEKVMGEERITENI